MFDHRIRNIDMTRRGYSVRKSAKGSGTFVPLRTDTRWITRIETLHVRAYK